MIKRLCALGAVVALVALPVGAVGPAAGSSGDSNGDDHVIRVLSITDEETFVDTGDAGPSLGDQFVFSSTLKKHGEEVGHTGAACTLTSLERSESHCVGTAWFEDGQITVQGLVSEEASRFTIAITGGTGAYEGASGEVTVRVLAEGRERIIFHLDD